MMPGASPHRVALKPTGNRNTSAMVVLLTGPKPSKNNSAPPVANDRASASPYVAGAGNPTILGDLRVGLMPEQTYR